MSERDRGTPWTPGGDGPAPSSPPVPVELDEAECRRLLATATVGRIKKLGADKLVIAGMQTDFCVDTACRVAHGLGYNVTLAEDAHTTLDNDAMTAEQLIAYHGGLLKDRFAKFKPVAQIDFAD